MENLDIDGRIIFKRILGKSGLGVQTHIDLQQALVSMVLNHNVSQKAWNMTS
jgi:hypothetical protein